MHLPGNLCKDPRVSGPISRKSPHPAEQPTPRRSSLARFWKTELGSKPLGHFFDGLVHLGHTTGAEKEIVLPFGQRTQGDVDPSRLSSLSELEGFPNQKLVRTVVDHDGRKAGQVGLEHIDSRIVRGHTSPFKHEIPKQS